METRKKHRCALCIREIEEFGENEALIPCDAEWMVDKEEPN